MADITGGQSVSSMNNSYVCNIKLVPSTGYLLKRVTYDLLRSIQLSCYMENGSPIRKLMTNVRARACLWVS